MKTKLKYLALRARLCALLFATIIWLQQTCHAGYLVNVSFVTTNAVISSRETGVYCAFRDAHEFSEFYYIYQHHFGIYQHHFGIFLVFEVCTTKKPEQMVQLCIADDKEIVGSGAVFNGVPGFRPGVAERVAITMRVDGIPWKYEYRNLYLVCTAEKSFEAAKKAYQKGKAKSVLLAKITPSTNSSLRVSENQEPWKIKPEYKRTMYEPKNQNNPDSEPLSSAKVQQPKLVPYELEREREREIFYAQNPGAALGEYERQHPESVASKESKSEASPLVKLIAYGVIIAFACVVIAAIWSAVRTGYEGWSDKELASLHSSGSYITTHQGSEPSRSGCYSHWTVEHKLSKRQKDKVHTEISRRKASGRWKPDDS